MEFEIDMDGGGGFIVVQSQGETFKLYIRHTATGKMDVLANPDQHGMYADRMMVCPEQGDESWSKKSES